MQHSGLKRPSDQVHQEAGSSSSPNSMAFDHSAQERCPLQLDSISPSLIYPQEKLCLGMEVTLFVVVNYKEGNQCFP